MKYRISKIEYPDGRCSFTLAYKKSLFKWAKVSKYFDTAEQAKDHLRKIDNMPTISLVEKGRL